jgi:protein subunit release factor A
MAKKIIKKGKNKPNNKNHQNPKSQNKLQAGGADKADKENTSNLIQESVKDHFFTFQLKIDLFTVLYSTLVFKWIQTDRVRKNYEKLIFKI